MSKKTPLIYLITSILLFITSIALDYFSLITNWIESAMDISNLTLIGIGFILFLLFYLRKYPHKKFILMGLLINILFLIVRIRLY